MSWCTCDDDEVLEEILASCYSLKKLSLKGKNINCGVSRKSQNFEIMKFSVESTKKCIILTKGYGATEGANALSNFKKLHHLS